MATSLAQLVVRTRLFMRDYPLEDALTASVTSSGTSLSVADTEPYKTFRHMEIDQEAILCTSLASSTALTVRRGQRGTTAASHASGAKVYVRPSFFYDEYVEAINDALESCFPYAYQEITDESLTGVSGQYEYEIPDISTDYPIPWLAEIQIQESEELAFRKVSRWDVVRGTTPVIRFRSPLSGGETIRVMGYGPFSRLVSASDELPDHFPPQILGALPIGAASFLMASGEAGRVRVDTGAIDNREQANATGSSMRGADALFNRFEYRIRKGAMPPPTRHVKKAY